MSRNGKDYHRDPEVVKRMARLMMQGAVMLAETCPICGLPLFRLRSGEVICPVHGRVLIVSSDEEAEEARIDSVVGRIESYATSRVEELLGKGSPGEILEWLKVVEAAERIRKLRGERRMLETGKSQAERRGSSSGGRGE